MKNIRTKLPAVIAIITFIFVGCSDLDENLEDRLTLKQVEESLEGETPDVTSLLTEAYATLREIHGSGADILAAHTSDTWIAPTRGGDWDDNGAWRALHQHTWDADHGGLRNYYNRCTSGLFSAIDILQFSPNAQQEAEVRFLRAFYVFWTCDGWGQVPMREPGAPLSEIPYVLSSSEAIAFVISELEAIVGNLPANDDPWVATQAAAYALLAKAYLNKPVFDSDDRQTFTFGTDDMNKVISNCNTIINSGNFALESDYFDNFTSDNGENSSELIFCCNNIAGIQSNSMRGSWMGGLHYNQTPSGWNGFTTLADFYNTFEDDDQRKSTVLPTLQAQTGLLAGLAYGQQYNAAGEALQDRQGNPLSFTLESPIMVSGALLEVSGVRVFKYIPDMDMESTPGNDFPFLRYADVLLSKAEALMRTGDNTGALTIVNDLRAVRGASALASLTEADMLAERGRELYNEGWRRNDLVRYGKFLDAWSEKPASVATYLLFPFPSAQIVANPSLQQNPGY
ncbi:MAG: RagB/SusD family nutrient uptake outer membrane protein [Bacteroidales bacterium]|nr:RagB/SusD family nutrient uptake outer membrane protein [Bacteroidales bacterium]